ncbi:MAG: glycosyltransferase family 4 protein [Bacteroidetes bacterium]|nr:glycosyltransferase family 4 protein [Bacteroidota bacterium]MCY4204518.1 glycosyltransferase family 4 protein [Bacteroidota bacterium]
MRILIHDFGAYAFPVTLSHTLQSRGYDVGHAYCNSLTTTPNNVSENSTEITLLPIQTSRPLNKYSFIQRWLQEKEYGRLAARTILDFRPDIVISANTPLNAQQYIQKMCRQNGIPFIFWLQDLIGVAASKILKARLPFFASSIGSYFQMIEAQLLRRSDAVILITEDFCIHLQKLGISPDRYHIIENWGTLAPFQGNPSTWAKQYQLEKRPLLLYAGTLSMKHNPAILADLAQHVDERAHIVVVSQGAGADWLKKTISERDISNLTILPYQPREQLPAMYAAAQILLVLLTEDAGEFSVPSKVLTCLCAGKPILTSAPKANLASRILECSGAGLVTEPDDFDSFTQDALMLIDEPELCQSMGKKGQAWANRKFDLNRITDQFELALKHALQ